MIKYTDLLETMFNGSAKVTETNNVVTGYAAYQNEKFAVAGVVNEAMLDNAMSLAMADFILNQTEKNLLIIVDTGGQQATRKAELFGLNRYFAHLIKVIHYKRSQGLRVFAVVHGHALGGAFIATALNAEKIYALPEAQISVMWLEAMSRVTKVPLAKLQELSKVSPIFAPGADNFYKLGAVEEILSADKIMPKVLSDLATNTATLNDWRNNGSSRGGRNLAVKIVDEIINA